MMTYSTEIWSAHKFLCLRSGNIQPDHVSEALRKRMATASRM